MATILQATFYKTFSWKKIFVFQFSLKCIHEDSIDDDDDDDESLIQVKSWQMS